MKRFIISKIALIILFLLIFSTISFADTQEENYVYETNLITGETTKIDLNEILDTIDTVDTNPFNPKEVFFKNGNDGLYPTFSTTASGSTLIRTIVGTDDRFLADTSSMPYATVGFLGIDNGNTNGTAFLVDNNIAVTAAHCVVGHDYFQFYPGSTYSTHPYGEAWVTSYIWAGPTNYTGDGDFNDDWAILILDTNVGNNAGWFGVSNLAEIPNGPSSWVGLDARTSGYPFDGGLNQWASQGNILTASDQLMTFNADVRQGNSGGPVFRYSGGYFAYAVATGELTDNMDYNPNAYNFATRFNSTVYNSIMYAKSNY